MTTDVIGFMAVSQTVSLRQFQGIGRQGRPLSQHSERRLTSGARSTGARASTTISFCHISSHRISADAPEAPGELGFRRNRQWFAPHFELRFPRIGEVTLRGATLGLRHALEPWHGEQAVVGGTARYVDGSVERVQARVDGWVEERCVLACNRRAVPLKPTDRAGEYAGG
jgi:uncharacterized protein (DUF2126 family)